MKPRWLRHMIPMPSPGPIPISAKAWARALVRRCTRSKVSEPRSSISIVSCGYLYAAVATPVAGEAPQRKKVATTLAVLSGRDAPTTPASRSTFASKTASETDWRTPAAMEPRVPIGSGSLVAIDRGHGDAGDPLAAPDPAHALVRRRLDADPSRCRLGQDPLHLGAERADAGLLADERRVDVDDPAGDHADDRAQQVDRVGALPALVVVGEVGPDVAHARSAEQRVDHGVGEDVGI